jgi:hypothetical protein
MEIEHGERRESTQSGRSRPSSVIAAKREAGFEAGRHPVKKGP